MNNTTKAKYDLAEKMLKGRIDIDEVVMMSGLDKKEVQEIKDKLDSANKDASALKGLDRNEIGTIFFEDFDDFNRVGDIAGTDEEYETGDDADTTDD